MLFTMHQAAGSVWKAHRVLNYPEAAMNLVVFPARDRPLQSFVINPLVGGYIISSDAKLSCLSLLLFFRESLP